MNVNWTICADVRQEMDTLGEPTLETFPEYLELNEKFSAEVLGRRKTKLEARLDRLLSLPLASRRALVSLQTKFPESSEIFVIARDQHRK